MEECADFFNPSVAVEEEPFPKRNSSLESSHNDDYFPINAFFLSLDCELYVIEFV